MAGYKDPPELLGLKPRMIRRAYQMAQENKRTHEYEISCQMIEIYLNEVFAWVSWVMGYSWLMCGDLPRSARGLVLEDRCGHQVQGQEEVRVAQATRAQTACRRQEARYD